MVLPKLVIIFSVLLSLPVMAECPEKSRSCTGPRSERTFGNTDNQGVTVIGAKNKGDDSRIIIDGDTIIQNQGKLQSNDNISGLVVIKGNRQTKEIILSNLDINATNINSEDKKNKALVVIEAPKNTHITAKNIRINARRNTLVTYKNKYNHSYSNLISIKSENGKIDTSNIRVNSEKNQLKSIK